MQIHELETFIGTTSDTTYLAIDDGTETNKIPATSVGVSTEMTQAEIEAGTETAPRVISPAVLSAFVGSSVTEEQGAGYVRFGNGIQICWIEATVTMAISNAYGSLYQGTYTWTFPKEFISAPAVSVGAIRWGTSAGWATLGGAPTTTSVILRGIDIASRASGNTLISAIAIGKWK